MPGTKEIRTKIASVKSTQKITKAMQMVATSKMRRAQDRMKLARPYADKIRARDRPSDRGESGLPASVPGGARAEVDRHHRHLHGSRSRRRPEREHLQAGAAAAARVAGQGRAGEPVPHRQQGPGVLPPPAAADPRQRHGPRRPAAREGSDRHREGDARRVSRRADRPAVPGERAVREHHDAEADASSSCCPSRRSTSKGCRSIGTTSTSRIRGRFSMGC